MSTDTANWVKSYPFTVDGVEFVSMLDPNGSIYSSKSERFHLLVVIH
jgi:hypothetical protein